MKKILLLLTLFALVGSANAAEMFYGRDMYNIVLKSSNITAVKSMCDNPGGAYILIKAGSDEYNPLEYMTVGACKADYNTLEDIIRKNKQGKSNP